MKDKITNLNNRIYLIDDYDLHIPERTGTYVIDEQQLTLIETGPSLSVPHIKAGLSSLGFSLNQVKYIVLTHIHLDHAGGVGLLIKECPNATVVVHPRGARHLANPERLIASARAVYGEQFSELFDPVLPVSENRITVKADGEKLKIGEGCELEFFDTPGHAKHHFCIYDPVSHGVFTGDTVGIRYQQLIGDGLEFFLPTTSPNQFDPGAMQAAIERLQKMNLKFIYFGHFGMTENTQEALSQVSDWLKLFVEEGKKADMRGDDSDALARTLFNLVKNHLSGKNIQDNHSVYQLLQLDMKLCALGITEYYKKLK